MKKTKKIRMLLLIMFCAVCSVILPHNAWAEVIEGHEGDSIEICGEAFIENGEIVGSLPEGMRFDAENYTLILDNYSGTVDDFFIWSNWELNIKLIGKNNVYTSSEFDRWGLIRASGPLKIFGSGSLNIVFEKVNSSCRAIGAAGYLCIEDCTINLEAKKIDNGYFDGIELAQWQNQYDEVDDAAIIIDHATVNIKQTMNKSTEKVNNGIFAADADLKIKDSKINITLKNGYIGGLYCGMYSNGKKYGGKLTVDEDSEIVVHADSAIQEEDSILALYCFKYDIASPYVRSGSMAPGIVQDKSDLYKTGTFERVCFDRFLEISPHAWSIDSVEKKAVLDKDGKMTLLCDDCGASRKSEPIPALSSITLKSKSGTYNGEKKNPTIVIVDRIGNTLPKKTAKITCSTGLKKVGAHKLTVTSGSKLYSISKKFTYTIKPKGTSISELKAGSKSFTAKWKAQKTQTTGYEIRYSLKSSMESAKKVKITKNSTVSKKVEKLKKGKTYYVQIRTYKMVDDEKFVSSWSKYKKIKVK